MIKKIIAWIIVHYDIHSTPQPTIKYLMYNDSIHSACLHNNLIILVWICFKDKIS